MEKQLHEELLKDIDELKNLIKGYSTLSIVNTVAMILRQQHLPEEKQYFLSSPAKQCFYLLGILQLSKEPKKPKELDKSSIEKIIQKLEVIFNYYALMFFPSDDEYDELTEEWYRIGEVAMPAFLHYFNTSLMASAEQIQSRIRNSFTKFDKIIVDSIGIPVDECLQICTAVVEKQERNLEGLYDTAEKEIELRHNLLDKAEQEQWSPEQLRFQTSNSEYTELMHSFLSQMNNLFAFSPNDLNTGDKDIQAFIREFSLQRGTGTEFTYITEENPAEIHPLMYFEDDKYFCPSTNALYLAVLKKFESILFVSSEKQKWFSDELWGTASSRIMSG